MGTVCLAFSKDGHPSGCPATFSTSTLHAGVFVCRGVRYRKEGDRQTVFFKVKAMIDLPKIFFSYVTRKGINGYTVGNP